MKKIYLLIGISCLFANELEVDGSLKVSGGVDVQGNVISNVGDPVNPTDAVNMNSVGGVVNNILSLAGMEPPERIYTKSIENVDSGFDATVPDGKIWCINITGAGIYFVIDGKDVYTAGENSPIIWVLQNSTISLGQSANKNWLTIFEYSITSSGTDQGMDYIVP